MQLRLSLHATPRPRLNHPPPVRGTEFMDCVREFVTKKKLSKREFVASFGVRIDVVEELLSRLECDAIVVLMGLHFLKCYPTEKDGSRFFECGRESWRSRVTIALTVIGNLFFSLIRWQNRCRDGEFCCIVGSFCCPLQRPARNGASYLSSKTTYAFKYEVAVHPEPPHHTVWVYGPVRGSVKDVTIARAKLIKKLNKTVEVALGGCAYRGEAAIVTPQRGPESFDNNQRLNQIRHALELEFSALKKFSALRSKWRGELDSHPDAFYACCVVHELHKLVTQRNKRRDAYLTL